MLVYCLFPGVFPTGWCQFDTAFFSLATVAMETSWQKNIDDIPYLPKHRSKPFETKSSYLGALIIFVVVCGEKEALERLRKN